MLRPAIGTDNRQRGRLATRGRPRAVVRPHWAVLDVQMTVTSN